MAGVRIVVDVEKDRRLELAGAGDSGVEVVHLEPEQHTIADGAGRVTHGTVMVIDLPSVKLQDQTVGAPLAGVELGIPQALILGSAMAAHAPQKPLVEAAGGLNVAAIDQGLGAHGSNDSSSATAPRFGNGAARRGMSAALSVAAPPLSVAQRQRVSPQQPVR